MTYQYLNDNKGFFSIHFILVSGLIFLIFFCFSFLSFISVTKMNFLSICLTDSIALQKKIIKAEKQLFQLNPLSTALETKRNIAAAELAAAVVSGNAPVIAKATATLMKIRSDQLQLQQSQLIIILSTSTLIKLETASIVKKIHASTTKTSENWSNYFRIFFDIRPKQIGEMAVRPLTSGLAPNYELKAGYKELQTVAFLWQFKYFTKSESQKLLVSENSFLVSCGIKPQRKANIWSVEIQKDKYF